MKFGISFSELISFDVLGARLDHFFACSDYGLSSLRPSKPEAEFSSRLLFVLMILCGLPRHVQNLLPIARHRPRLSPMGPNILILLLGVKP